MPSIGDISVAMGIDDSKWFAGAVRIQNEAKRMEAQLNGMGRGGGIGGGLGRSVGQAAFAVQDFTSVLGMGGDNALGRALMSTMNNVQMLGAAFGPWGMAVTAAAGAVGSILIPKLLEGGAAIKSLSETAKDAFKEVQKLGSADMSFAKGLAGIDKTKTVSGMRERIDDIDLESRMNARTKVSLKQTLKEQHDAAVAAGLFLVDRTRGVDRMSGLPVTAIAENAWGTKNPEGVKAMEAIQEGIKALGEMEKAERDLSLMRDHAVRALERNAEEERRTQNEKDAKAFEEEQAQARKARADRAASILQSSRSPYDTAMSRIGEIRNLADILGPDQAGRALDDVLGDFTRGRNSNRANQALRGGEFGTAEGFSSILASIRQSEGAKGDEQVVLLREQVATAKDALTELRKQSKSPVRVETWNN